MHLFGAFFGGSHCDNSARRFQSTLKFFLLVSLAVCFVTAWLRQPVKPQNKSSFRLASILKLRPNCQHRRVSLPATLLRAAANRNGRRRDLRWVKARAASLPRDIQGPYFRYKPIFTVPVMILEARAARRKIALCHRLFSLKFSDQTKCMGTHRRMMTLLKSKLVHLTLPRRVS